MVDVEVDDCVDVGAEPGPRILRRQVGGEVDARVDVEPWNLE